MNSSNYKNKDFIHLWIYTKKTQEIIISDKEIEWSKTLSSHRAKEFKESRSLLRKSLSFLFNIDPLNVPIIAKPNRPPELIKEYGFVSLSHSNGAFLVGWSKNKLGIDIENKYRKLNAIKLFNKIFTENEKNTLMGKSLDYKNQILTSWTMKESAVKWERSSIFSNLKNWEIDFNKNKINNLKKNILLDIECFSYKDWFISTATQKNNKFRSNILCSF